MSEDYTKEFIELERNITSFFREMRTRHIIGADLFNLSVPQFVCIWTISKMEKVKMSDIADILALSYASATNLINKLSQAKLINRYDDPQDRRVVYVELSEKGKELTDNLRSKHIARFNEWYSNASKEKRAHLMNGLSILTEIWKDFKIEG